MNPKLYYDTHAVKYEEPECTGFLSLEVLPFLKGKPWDEVALAYVHSLRPSSIRVTEGTIKLDARTNRVTVYVNDDNTITEIKQEVSVGLPDEVAHGEALQYALEYGIDSEEVQWFNDDMEGTIYRDGKMYKWGEKNGTVPFPERKG